MLVKTTLRAKETILCAGLLCGIMDISAAFLLIGLLHGSSPLVVLQSVASGLLGAASYEGGIITAALGLLIHFFIATSAAAVFYAASRKLTLLLRYPLVAGVLYGIAVYAFMNLVVLPLSAFPNEVSFVIGPMLVIHMLCVGLPISLCIWRFSQ